MKIDPCDTVRLRAAMHRNMTLKIYGAVKGREI